MFFDRHMAGKVLAKKLARYKHQDGIIYALPKGGVPVGYEVSKALGLPLDFMTVQKIGHPTNREYGICSVSEAGNIVCDECGTYGIDRDWLSNEISIKGVEAVRRRYVYKRGEASVSAENKIAIIVDDGVATGLTMKAAVEAMQEQWPEKIIIAAPVIPHELMAEFRAMADMVVTVVADRQYLGTVDAYYSDFSAVTDQEVVSLLASANHDFVANLGKNSSSSSYRNDTHVG
jgi:putative phosphoribosyl transferase